MRHAEAYGRADPTMLFRVTLIACLPGACASAAFKTPDIFQYHARSSRERKRDLKDPRFKHRTFRLLIIIYCIFRELDPTRQRSSGLFLSNIRGIDHPWAIGGAVTSGRHAKYPTRHWSNVGNRSCRDVVTRSGGHYRWRWLTFSGSYLVPFPFLCTLTQFENHFTGSTTKIESRKLYTPQSPIIGQVS
jgi:hypothetical protein